MSQSIFVSWFKEKFVPLLLSVAIPLGLAPWLLLAYWGMINYTTELRSIDREMIVGFVEWFGTAYSFFLALALVNVWSQFETVDREFDRELDAVSSLLQTVKYTQTADKQKKRTLGTFRAKVKGEIKNYLDHVIRNCRYEHQASGQRRKGDRILERIGEHISLLTSKEIVPEPFINQLFHSLNEAMDVRGDRIAHSKPYTPPIIQLMAFITSFIWLLAFLGIVLFDPWVIVLLIGSAAFVIIMVLVIFVDLGEPFEGIWKINADSWKEFRDTVDHDSDPHVIFIYSTSNSIFGVVRWSMRWDICHLHDLAHPGLLNTAWNDFLARVKEPRPTQKDHPAKCFEYHCNELAYYGVDRNSIDCPLVLLTRGDKQAVIMDRDQIGACPDLVQFEKVFNENMKKHIRWF